MVAVAAVAVGVATLTCAAPVRTAAADPDVAPAPAPVADPGLARLDALPIRGRAPKTGYDRAFFGQSWSDDVTVPDGHNGCDTRNDILRRDLVDIEIKPGTNGCVVLSGVLNDPYTGDVISFQRGRGTSRAVQIDHVVALSDAWQKGAQQWDELTARNFANDPLNLQATEGAINEQKGDGDAATWLPPSKGYRCTYVSRIVDVKAGYRLWVTQAEHDAIARILATDCGGPGVEPPAPLLSPVQAGSGDTTYLPNCAAARAAGVAPIFAGQPGYRPGLDGDGDGVACE